MKDMDFLKQQLFAHRGLHNQKEGVIENTKEAFQLAIQYQYAIELDVHLLKDGEIVVFHDDNLERLLGINQEIRDLTFPQMQQLLWEKNGIELSKFSDILNLVNGKVPLLIELKYDADVIALSKKVEHMLKTYTGQYAVQSFHPYVVRWFKKYSPNTVRGQLYMDEGKKNWWRNHIFNYLGKPDFISYNIQDLNLRKSANIRKKYLLLAWTVRTKEEYEIAKKQCDNCICEGFIWNIVKSVEN